MIDEFDHSLQASLNFAEPECFKSMILPLGLQEIRVVLEYEIMN